MDLVHAVFPIAEDNCNGNTQRDAVFLTAYALLKQVLHSMYKMTLELVSI